MEINIDLSIVVPVYNEADNIRLLWQRGNAALKSLPISYEWIFVDDGSRDNSLDRIKEMADLRENTRFITFSRNFGHQVAVSAGIDHAIGRSVVIIDADLQDPPELIPELFKKKQEGYEVVYARRKTRAGESQLKLWTAKWFYRILSRLTQIPIPLDTGDFRIIDRKVVEALKQMPERHKFLRGQIAWIGYRQTFIEYDREERFSGKSTYSWNKMIRFALDGITAFSDVPLRLVTYFGFIVSLIAFLVGLYALYAKFITRDIVPGWASLMISILFIGGVQMIAIGIIGEYISRLQADVRQRPLYVIKETNCHVE
jgi:polyisoprenyl-phosphate glycosyltransferase